MKKLLSLTALFAVLTISANAQTEQGRIVVSGKTGLDFLSSTVKPYYDGDTDADLNETVSKFSIAPSAGYFIIDNLAVGLSAAFSTAKQKTGSGNWSDPQTSYAIGPFVTYYAPLEGMVKPFVTATGGFGGLSQSNDNDDKYSGPVFGGGLGVAIFFNNNVSLDLGAQYLRSNYKNKDDNKLVLKGGTLGASVGFSVFF